MPLDDLDDLLALELGSKPEHKKISEQVSSLEAHVLNRVQQDHPLFERQEKPPEPTVTVEPEPSLDPLYQFVDVLMSILARVKSLLVSADRADLGELSEMRTELAEALLNLPDSQTLDTASIFGAMATCIDAAGSAEVEKRRVALERLNRLAASIATAQYQAEQARAQAIDQFLAE